MNNADGLKRYMTHIDNPDKYQYSKTTFVVSTALISKVNYKISETGKACDL